MDQDIFISVVVLSFCGLIYSSYRTWVWTKRSGKRGVDATVLSKLLVLTCGVVANIICAVNVVAAIVWFVMFKKKSIVKNIRAPPQELYSFIYFLAALVFKFIHTLHSMTMSAKVDVFFIDWEKPKVAHLWSRLIQATKEDQKTKDLSKEKMTEVNEKDEPSVDSKVPSPDTGVGIWRPYFVANEWIELYPYRSLSLEWHMLLLVMCLNVSQTNIHVSLKVLFSSSDLTL